MQIFVRTANGKTITIDVEDSGTVKEVKLKIREKEEISPGLYFHLKHRHQYLSDENAISSYSIQKESILWMVWPFTGDTRGMVSGLGAVSSVA